MHEKVRLSVRKQPKHHCSLRGGVALAWLQRRSVWQAGEELLKQLTRAARVSLRHACVDANCVTSVYVKSKIKFPPVCSRQEGNIVLDYKYTPAREKFGSGQVGACGDG